MKRNTVGLFIASVLVASQGIGSQAFAADMAARVTPPAPAPVTIDPWTGFYLGGEVGGGWAHRTVTYSPNDAAASLLTFAGFAVPGEQGFSSNRLNMSGVTGGLEAGYNWQVNRAWLVGIETDFNGSDLKGTGSTTAALPLAPPISQSVSEQQKIDWYGTLRARAGWLPSENLLLFVTGGLAYGRVANSGTYIPNGVAGLSFAGALAGASFTCTNNTVCFAGSSSAVRTGWTLGAGAEWMLWRNWSLKAEYQYVNLGNDSVRLTAAATAAAAPGTALSSFNANFTRDDFQVVRGGLNYHF